MRVLGALLLVLSLPASVAHAGVVTHSGTTLRYTGTAVDDDQIGVRRTGNDIAFTSPGTTPLSEDTALCNPNSGGVVNCPGAATGLTRMLMIGLDGADQFEFSDLGSLIAEADLGPGDDTANPVDELTPFRLVLHGGAGRDSLYGGKLDDALFGGDGEDMFYGRLGADEFSGGAGTDGVSYNGDNRSGGIRADIDDVADDGAIGEQDNVRSDIEDLYGTSAGDELTGNGEANLLWGDEGNDMLNGGGGGDVLVGDVLRGLVAYEDTILARDGVADWVDCGGGADTLESDTIDSVAGCETNNSSNELVPDRDGDGVDRPLDCDDANPARHPGATDVPGNGVDEDCSGADAVVATPTPTPTPTPASVAAQVTRKTRPVGRKTRFTALAVTGLLAGDTIMLSCSSRCGIPARTLAVAKPGTRSLLSLVRRALAAGKVLEIRVTRPGATGAVIRLTMRARRAPLSQKLCLPVGSSKPKAC